MMMASCARSSLRRMLPRVTSSLMPTFSGHIAVTPINTHRFYHSSVSHLFSSVDKEAAENTVVGRCSSLLKQLSPVSCRVRASNDDPNGSHIFIEIVSADFEGKSTVQRQRLIYKAIWDEMQSGRVHAVDGIIAKTPAEASTQ